MSTVRIALWQSTRGQFNILRYRFQLDIRFAPADPWITVPCLIDTAAPFTVMPRTILAASTRVPRLTCAKPPNFQRPGDYLGAFWYRFPAQFATPAVRIMEFRCDECRVTTEPTHYAHLAMRDIRTNFYIDSDHATDELILTLRPVNLGLIYRSGS
jgi:hypothetical protein